MKKFYPVPPNETFSAPTEGKFYGVCVGSVKGIVIRERESVIPFKILDPKDLTTFNNAFKAETLISLFHKMHLFGYRIYEFDTITELNSWVNGTME
jgi:hypothetical protein